MSQVRLWHDADLGVDLLRAVRLTHTFSTHAHPELLLAAFSEGAEVFDAAGQRWTASAGEVLLIPPGLAHDGAAASSGGYSYRACYLQRSRVERIVDDANVESLPAEPVLFRGGALGARAFKGLVDLQADHLSVMERQEILASLLADVLLPLSRQRRLATPVNPRAAALARAYLHEHFARHLTTADLAAVAGVSESRLSHLFSGAYRCSPGVYQMALRLAEARRLIRCGHPLAEVAAQLGFADQAHLTRRFKAALGVTPGRLR
jgi:AraC-like DNA-binding protein